MSTIKRRLGRISTDLTLKGEVVLGRPEIVRAGQCLVRFLLAFTLSQAEIFGGYTPFGVAIVAISGPGFTGLMALCGVVLGSYIGNEFVWGLKYMAMSVLVFAASFTFHDLSYYRRNWFMPTVAAFMAACTGFVYAQDLGWTVEATVFFLTETALVGGGAYFFQIALSGWGREIPEDLGAVQRTVSILILMGAVLITLSSVTFLAGISLGRLLALFILMSTAYRSGAGSGSAVGAALGLSMDAALGGVPFFSMAYAFSGLLSGVFARHGKILFTFSFILAKTVAVLWTWDTVLYTAALYEVFLISAFFLISPAHVLGKFTVDLGDTASYYGGVRIKAYAKDRMRHLGRAFHALYETVHTPTSWRNNDNDIATVFDRAAELCCRKCPQSAICWHREYESTVDVMNNVTAPMLKRGQLKREDFPQHFAEHCKNLDAYIAAANDELKALTYRKQFLSRLQEARTAMCMQYQDMGAILETLARDLDTDLTHEPFREKRLHRYLRSRDMEAEAAVFRDRNGRLHAEVKAGSLSALTKDPDHLAKLSAVLGVRLCQKRKKVDSNSQTMGLMEAEPLAATVGIASVKRKGQVVSGDRGTSFKTDDGNLYVILSDGMGTGDGAARESGQAIHILEQFLKAGLHPAAAMKLMNTALQAKNGQAPGFATVDLMGVNLFTGETKLFKYGAAPTYVKRGRAIRAIRGESLAAGLVSGDGRRPDTVTMRLEPGNFAVISSDGISQSEDDTWLRSLMADYTGTDAKELARHILEAALKRFGSEDDMTVLTIFLEERP
ncbi:MAG: SpoIIE family protein phosphatase [Oscillospiraceae bacterium]|nr:SpoIIE family protein phosphatase [Oscillospiraceae bacterium]